MKTSHVFATVALIGLGYAAGTQSYQPDGNPILARDNSFVLKDNGLVEIDGIVSNTTLDFKKSSTKTVYLFGLANSETMFPGLSEQELADVSQIQKKACDLAAGRQGYSDACPS